VPGLIAATFVVPEQVSIEADRAMGGQRRRLLHFRFIQKPT
jgi:hypothetical protein